MLRWSGFTSYLGGIFALVLDSVSTGVVALLALLMNWYFLRRRDKREQEKHELEMNQ